MNTARTTTTVVTALSALGLVLGGLAASPSAHGAPASAGQLPAARAAATAPAPLSFEFVSTWGSFGPGFGKLNLPRGIDVVGDRLYVAEAGTHSIEVKHPSGGAIYNFQETASTDVSRFSSPSDIAVVNNELFYVADSGNHRISRYEAGTFTVWGTYGSGLGQMSVPVALDVGDGGHVYVADRDNRRVQEFTAAGTLVRTWGGFGDGPGQVLDLRGLATGPDGSVYVTDRGQRRVTRFTAAGGYVGHWGETGPGALVEPRGIDVAPDGTVYVVDAQSDLVNVYTASGELRGTLGGPGPGEGLFLSPWGVAVGADGYVKVSDESGHTVQTFRPVLAALAAPVVSGSAKVGSTLHASGGSWPVPDVTLSYQWLRDGVPIAGAASSNYKLVPGDAGRKVSVRVSASRADYGSSSSATSSLVKVVKLKAKVKTKLAKKAVKVGKRVKVTVRVRVPGIAKPKGTLVIRDGKKKVATVKLKAKHAGKRTVKLPKLKAGKHKITVTFKATKQIAKSKAKPKTLRVRR